MIPKIHQYFNLRKKLKTEEEIIGNKSEEQFILIPLISTPLHLSKFRQIMRFWQSH